MNPAVWVERHGRLRPGDPALAEGERVHATWRTFAARTAAAAAGLRDDFGLSPGERVAIVMRNRPEYLEALFAIWHAGLVAVPVNARLHRDEIAYILEHSGAIVAVTDAEHAGDVESLVGTVGFAAGGGGRARGAVGPAARRRRRHRSSTGGRTTRPGCSTRAAPPAGPREPRSRTATCS